jgi:hypothetical protein
MASIEVIIRDDEGKVIGKGRSQTDIAVFK